MHCGGGDSLSETTAFSVSVREKHDGAFAGIVHTKHDSTGGKLSHVAREVQRKGLSVSFGSAEVYSFDPDPDYVVFRNAVQAYCKLKTLPFQFTGETLKEYLAKPDAGNSCIVLKRVDPRIFVGESDINYRVVSGAALRVFDHDQSLFDSTGLAIFVAKYKPQVLDIVAQLMARLSIGGQMYISVGEGNNDYEYMLRAGIMSMLNTVAQERNIPHRVTGTSTFPMLRQTIDYQAGHGDMASVILSRTQVHNDDWIAKARHPSIWKNIKRNDPCPCCSGKKVKQCHLGKNMNN